MTGSEHCREHCPTCKAVMSRDFEWAQAIGMTVPMGSPPPIPRTGADFVERRVDAGSGAFSRLRERATNTHKRHPDTAVCVACGMSYEEQEDYPLTCEQAQKLLQRTARRGD